jgi:hypothetical protein
MFILRWLADKSAVCGFKGGGFAVVAVFALIGIM